MSLQSSIVLLLVLLGCIALPARGQSDVQKVVARSSDDESGIAEPEGAGGGGGSSRTIYSHKHLSPHRMMHFGKRVLIPQPPAIFAATSQMFDPYRRQSAVAELDQDEQQQQQQPPSYPYAVYFPMARSSDAAPSAQQSGSFGPARDRQMLQVVQSLLGLPPRQRQQLLACDENLQDNQVQFRRPASALARPKPMRLVAADGQQQQADGSQGNNENLQTIYTAKKQSSSSNEAQQQSEGGQQEQQDSSATSNGRADGDEIDRASRSVGPPRPFMNRLTPAQFSMLLGGAPSSNSQASSLLNFIKKAEPQRMTFMHFGRRR